MKRAKFNLSYLLSGLLILGLCSCVPTRGKSTVANTATPTTISPTVERQSPKPGRRAPSSGEEFQIRIVRDSSDQSIQLPAEESGGAKLPLPHFAFQTTEGETISPNGVILPPEHESGKTRPSDSGEVAAAENMPASKSPPGVRPNVVNQPRENAPAVSAFREDIFEKTSPPESEGNNLAASQPEARAGLSRPAREMAQPNLGPNLGETAPLKRTPIEPPSDRNRQIFAAVMAVLVVLLLACMVLVKTEKSEEEKHNLPSNRRF